MLKSKNKLSFFDFHIMKSLKTRYPNLTDNKNAIENEIKLIEERIATIQQQLDNEVDFFEESEDMYPSPRSSLRANTDLWKDLHRLKLDLKGLHLLLEKYQ